MVARARNSPAQVRHVHSSNRCDSEADWGPIAVAAGMWVSRLCIPNVKAFIVVFEPLFAVELVTWGRCLSGAAAFREFCDWIGFEVTRFAIANVYY